MVHNGLDSRDVSMGSMLDVQAMVEVRAGDSREPLPMVWQSGGRIRGAPHSSAMANSDYLIEYLFLVVF